MRKVLALAAALFCAVASAATTTPVQLLSPAGSTSGQAIVSTGASTAPAWGNVVAGSLAPVGANTAIANTTGSTAAPTAVALPSCSTANSALKYTSGTGFSCGTTFALTSSNLSQFASTTSAQLLGVLSDETGTGAAVFGTSPSLTTPTIAGATLSGTFSGTPTFSGAATFTSTITPSQTAGIVGTTTNNNANAGSVGEYICAQVTNGGSPTGCATNSSTPVSLTTATTANITSISLSAGDWEIWGSVGCVPAGSTITNAVHGAISTTSATLPTISGGSYIYIPVAYPAGACPYLPIGRMRQSIASTTTFYLVTNISFTTSTNTAFGFIAARRVR